MLPLKFLALSRDLGGLPLPESADDYEEWRVRAGQLHAWMGPFNWTVRTALELKRAGMDVELTTTLPSEGVIVSHRDLLPNLPPRRRQLLVCLQADRRARKHRGAHPFAQLHLVQNPSDPLLSRASWLWPAVFVRHWPQSGLQPRRVDRGDRVERIGYFGIDENLATELRDPRFTAWLAERGIEFEIVPRERWADYREFDLTLAVRSFNATRPYTAKPASKLVNSWLAGVPAILGVESAYRALRRDPGDYVEVDSLAEVMAAIDRLRGDPSWYRELRAQAARRAGENGTDMVVAGWRALITGPIRAAWDEWAEASLGKRLGFVLARTAVWAAA